MSQTPHGLDLHSRVRLDSFDDPIIDAIGHAAQSIYVERYWLPILGPSTTLLVRHLVNELDRIGSPGEVDLTETARALGLGERTGRNGAFLRSLTRAIDFNMVSVSDDRVVRVRRFLPTLSPRHLARLPHALRDEHQRFINDTNGSYATMRRRGEQLALTLMELGATVEEVRLQLARWRFHPALIAQCATWAEREMRRRGRSQVAEGALASLGAVAATVHR